MAEKEVKLFSNTFMAAAFALANFVLVLLLMWTVSAEYSPEWKKYQREYYRLWASKLTEAELQADPGLKAKLLSRPLDIKQVWNAKLEVTDRCMTCHMGVENPKMVDAPQPFRTHPDMKPHAFNQIGCTVCHEGQGTATTKHDAHVMADLEKRYGPFDEQHMGWGRPLMPLAYVQASCNKCHNVMEAPVPGADKLNAGWQIVQEKGCKTCHYIVDSGAKQAPELSIVGTKFYNESGHSNAFHDLRFGYLRESLRCPQANMSPDEAKKCKATLETVAAASNEKPLSGDELVKKYPCGSCHSFDTPSTLLGPSLFDLGKRRDEAYIRAKILDPDKTVVEGFPKGVMKATLTGSGFYTDMAKNPAILDSLVSYLVGLKGTAGQAPGAAAVVVMPNFNLNDEELQSVVTFLLGLQEHNVPWPKKSFAQQASATPGQAAGGETWSGKSAEELIKTAGCNACHKLDGPEQLVGPSLWDIGGRQNKDYIRESIVEPDKVVAPGYPPGVMKATLVGTGFYQKISLEGLDRLVEYLSTLKGKP
ncbi:MAG: c-type cytochrome [Candidatus Tectimicrobiota bacterium]